MSDDTWDDEVADWLRTGPGAEPSAALLARIERAVAPAPATRRPSNRPDRAVAVCALLLSAAFVFQAVGNLVAGDWIAAGLGEHHSPHAYFEGALTLTAAGVCAAAAAVRRAWGSVSVLTCSPLAVGLGIGGLGEIGQFAPGVALHLTEGVLGLALLLAWWRSSRDTSAAHSEERS